MWRNPNASVILQEERRLKEELGEPIQGKDLAATPSRLLISPDFLPSFQLNEPFPAKISENMRKSILTSLRYCLKPAAEGYSCPFCVLKECKDVELLALHIISEHALRAFRIHKEVQHLRKFLLKHYVNRRGGFCCPWALNCIKVRVDIKQFENHLESCHSQYFKDALKNTLLLEYKCSFQRQLEYIAVLKSLRYCFKSTVEGYSCPFCAIKECKDVEFLALHIINEHELQAFRIHKEVQHFRKFLRTHYVKRRRGFCCPWTLNCITVCVDIKQFENHLESYHSLYFKDALKNTLLLEYRCSFQHQVEYIAVESRIPPAIRRELSPSDTIEHQEFNPNLSGPKAKHIKVEDGEPQPLSAITLVEKDEDTKPLAEEYNSSGSRPDKREAAVSMDQQKISDNVSETLMMAIKTEVADEIEDGIQDPITLLIKQEEPVQEDNIPALTVSEFSTTDGLEKANVTLLIKQEEAVQEDKIPTLTVSEFSTTDGMQKAKVPLLKPYIVRRNLPKLLPKLRSISFQADLHSALRFCVLWLDGTCICPLCKDKPQIKGNVHYVARHMASGHPVPAATIHSEVQRLDKFLLHQFYRGENNTFVCPFESCKYPPSPDNEVLRMHLQINHRKYLRKLLHDLKLAHLIQYKFTRQEQLEIEQLQNVQPRILPSLKRKFAEASAEPEATINGIGTAKKSKFGVVVFKGQAGSVCHAPVLNKSLSIADQAKCPVCGFPCVDLKNHIQNFHLCFSRKLSIRNFNSNVQWKNGSFPCPYCLSTFPDLVGVCEHTTIQHPTEVDVVTTETGILNSSLVEKHATGRSKPIAYVCEFGCRRFTLHSTEAFKIHLQLVHLQDFIKYLTSLKLRRLCQLKRKLKEYEENATITGQLSSKKSPDIRSFDCYHCSFKFYDKAAWTTHMCCHQSRGLSQHSEAPKLHTHLFHYFIRDLGHYICPQGCSNFMAKFPDQLQGHLELQHREYYWSLLTQLQLTNLLEFSHQKKEKPLSPAVLSFSKEPHKCLCLCGLTYGTQRDWAVHASENHPKNWKTAEEKWKSVSKPKSAKVPKLYKCPHCNCYKSETKDLVCFHIFSAHSHTEVGKPQVKIHLKDKKKRTQILLNAVEDSIAVEEKKKL